MLLRRQMDLLMKLINAGKAFSGFELANTFDVNVRTIRSDIKAINDFLDPHLITIQASNKFGYLINKNDIERFHHEKIFDVIKAEGGFELPQTPNERISYLIFMLSQQQPQSIEDLSDLLFISIPTIYNDLHVVSNLAQTKFKGVLLKRINSDKYVLVGEESAIRNMLSGIVSQRYDHILEQKYSEYIANDGSFLKTLYKIVEVILHEKNQHSFRLSGEGLYSFAADVALTVIREQHGLKLTYKINSLLQDFITLKNILSEEIEIMNTVSNENWCYLQDRFYSKSFLRNPKFDYNLKENLLDVIDRFHILLLNKYGIELVKDEKSIQYLSEYLCQIFYNNHLEYYWNTDDKDLIIENHSPCYLLAIELAYLVYESYHVMFDRSCLATLSLILEESMIRNANKKKAILITNKDKTHVLYLIHKLVSHFGNSFDLINNYSTYELNAYNLDLRNYDLLISSESLNQYFIEDYIRISTLCIDEDVLKIQEQIQKLNKKDDFLDYQIRIFEINQNINSINDVVKFCITELVQNGGVVQNRMDIDFMLNCIIIQIDETKLRFITPFITIEKTTVFKVSLCNNVEYKRRLYRNIELIIINPLDFTRIHKINKW